MGSYAFPTLFGESNYREHLRDDRLNGALIDEFCHRLMTTLTDQRKKEQSFKPEEDPQFTYRMIKMVHKSMPATFKNSVPLHCFVSKGRFLSQIKQFLQDWLSNFDGIENLAYRDLEVFRTNVSVKELVECLEKEYITQCAFYQEVKQKENFLESYMFMVREYLKVVLPSHCHRLITPLQVLRAGVFKEFKMISENLDVDMSHSSWVNVPMLVHLNKYFAFLSCGRQKISKEEFQICRHYRDYNFSNDFFSNSYTHAPYFTLAFIDAFYDFLHFTGRIRENGLCFESFVELQLMLDFKTYFFNVLDTNRDGVIDHRELSHFYESYQTVCDDPNNEDVFVGVDNFSTRQLLMILGDEKRCGVTLHDLTTRAASHGSGAFADLFLHSLTTPMVFCSHMRKMDGIDDSKLIQEEEEQQKTVEPDNFDYLLGERMNTSL